MSSPSAAAGADARPRGPRLLLPPVLMYHSVSASTGPDPHRLRVHPDRLDAHLRLLRRLGLRGVSLGELMAAADAGRADGLVGLTFDDGYTDFLDQAVPVLGRHGMTGTLYVVAGRLGGANEWDAGPRLDLLDADGVRAVARAGHEIGSHTLTHVRLSAADPVVVAREVTGSRRVLEDVLQSAVSGFCYPWGDFDEAAAETVRAAGYDHACVTGDYRPGDRFTVPRCYVAPEDGPVRLVAKLARHRIRVRTGR
ncbi:MULTISPECIES: polysaccharide deacetylase family protein [unclassified Geodermatophilus]